MPVAISGSRNQPQKKRSNIAVLGSTGVGKTSIIHRILNSPGMTLLDLSVHMDGSCYTVEVGNWILDIKEVSLKDGSVDILCSSFAEQVISTSEAFVLVYALNDRKSFEYLHDLKDAILTSQESGSPPIQVVGNKNDSVNREVGFVLADCTIAVDWDMKYTEISAKVDDDLYFILPSLIHPELLQHRAFSSPTRYQDNSTSRQFKRRRSLFYECIAQDCLESSETSNADHSNEFQHFQKLANSIQTKASFDNHLKSNISNTKSSRRRSSGFLNLKMCFSAAKSPDLSALYA